MSESDAVPSTYPIALAVTKDGQRAFVALVECERGGGAGPGERARWCGKVALLKPKSAIAAGTHPCALLLDERAGVTVCGAVEPRCGCGGGDWEGCGAGACGAWILRYAAAGAELLWRGAGALAMNAERTRLYVANMGSDAVAVLDPRKLRGVAKAKGMVEPLGFVPTELMPMALASSWRQAVCGDG